jgi:hypothetical protein
MSVATTAEVRTQYVVDAEEIRLAKLPHEVFLVNLIFNHVFLFVASLAVIRSFPQVVMLVPLVSVSCIVYILLRAQREVHNPSWFVQCHWHLAAKRNAMFMVLLLSTSVVIGGGWLISGFLNMAKIPTYALIGGLGLLPFMVTLLILVILGNEAVHLAKQGKLPAWVVQRYPYPETQPGTGR